MIIVFYEKFNFFSLLKLCFRMLFSRKKEMRIFYIISSEKVIRFAKLLIPLFNRKSTFSIYDYKLSDLKEDLGICPRLKCGNYTAPLIAEKDIFKDLFNETLTDTDMDFLKAYLFKVYFTAGTNQLENKSITPIRAMFLVEICIALKIKFHADKVDLIILPRPFIDPIKKYAETYDIYFLYDLWQFKFKIFHIRLFERILRVLKGKSSLHWNHLSVSKQENTTKNAKLCIYLDPNSGRILSPENEYYYSETFVVNGKDLKKEDVLVHPHHYKIKEKDIISSGYNVANPIEKDNTLSLSSLFHVRDDLIMDYTSYRWLKLLTLSFQNDVATNKYIYRKNYACINFRWDTSPRMLINLQALHSLGGIQVYRQRSYEDMDIPSLTPYAHINFSFSSLQKIACKDFLSYQVITGYLDDFRYKHNFEKAMEIKSELLKYGEKIIAFFDQSTADNIWYSVSNKDLREVYRKLIYYVSENDNICLLLKPKKPRLLNEILGEHLTKVLKNLINKGRVKNMIVESDSKLKLLNAIPVSLASIAADICIAQARTSITAGIESVLSGSPTYIYSDSAWESPVFSSLKKDKVLFENIEELLVVVDKDLAKNKRKQWGADVLNMIDPFRDGKARDRVSWFLSKLLGGLREGRDRDFLMKETAYEYATIWGEDKIIKLH